MTNNETNGRTVNNVTDHCLLIYQDSNDLRRRLVRIRNLLTALEPTPRNGQPQRPGVPGILSGTEEVLRDAADIVASIENALGISDKTESETGVGRDCQSRRLA